MDFIFDLAKIAGGLLLAQSVFMKYDAVDETVASIAKFLSGFQAIIGGVCLVLGVLFLLRSGHLIHDVSGVLAGLLLLGVSLKSVPVVGEYLLKASTTLKAFSIPIGIGAIASGVICLFF